jgi:hypothetical protein
MTEIVENYYVVTVFHKNMGDGSADVAGATGYQNAHDLSPLNAIIYLRDTGSGAVMGETHSSTDRAARSRNRIAEFLLSRTEKSGSSYPAYRKLSNDIWFCDMVTYVTNSPDFSQFGDHMLNTFGLSYGNYSVNEPAVSGNSDAQRVPCARTPGGALKPEGRFELMKPNGDPSAHRN